MDLRGLGQSTTKWKDFSAQSVGSDIVALIKHLNVSPERGVVVIGNSMAAAAAVW
jgi:pimeloyl-ACP methyl ester carboxylesterase